MSPQPSRRSAQPLARQSEPQEEEQEASEEGSSYSYSYTSESDAAEKDEAQGGKAVGRQSPVAPASAVARDSLKEKVPEDKKQAATPAESPRRKMPEAAVAQKLARPAVLLSNELLPVMAQQYQVEILGVRPDGRQMWVRLHPWSSA